MGKKRRTREQKIIAKLRRQLQAEKTEQRKEITKTVKAEKPKQAEEITKTKKAIDNFFSYDPYLIKKNLIKTLILSLVFCLIIFLLFYLAEIKKVLPL